MVTIQMTLDRMKHTKCQDNSARQNLFSSLRQHVSHLEMADNTAQLSCDLPDLDAALSGGVRAGYPHLVCGHLHDGAATGFVLALLDKMIMQNSDAVFIWCAAPYAGLQGQLSASGIAAHGISPAHFIFIDEQHPMQLMAAFEQALQTKSVTAVIAEYGVMHQRPDLWQRWIRRFRRAARTSGAFGLLLGADAPAAGLETKWHITSSCYQQAPESSPESSQWDEWPGLWDVELVSARGGRPYRNMLVWDRISRRFRHLPAQHQNSVPARHIYQSAASPALSAQPVSA